MCLQEYRGPDDQPGFLAVVKLATALVGLRTEEALSERRVDELIELYESFTLLAIRTGQLRGASR